jgi:hypothetical protein
MESLQRLENPALYLQHSLSDPPQTQLEFGAFSALWVDVYFWLHLSLWWFRKRGAKRYKRSRMEFSMEILLRVQHWVITPSVNRNPSIRGIQLKVKPRPSKMWWKHPIKVSFSLISRVLKGLRKYFACRYVPSYKLFWLYDAIIIKLESWIFLLSLCHLIGESYLEEQQTLNYGSSLVANRTASITTPLPLRPCLEKEKCSF